MISEANIQNLMRCVRNTENAKDMDLGTFISPCRTFGCLVGNDSLAVHGMYATLHLFALWEWAENEYGLSDTIAYFIFGPLNLRRGQRGIILRPNKNDRRECTNRDAALARLRKFIYYVLRKRELLYDDSGRVRETARRAEGNHMVLSKVAADVKARGRELQTVEAGT